jgi:hypothetical protein
METIVEEIDWENDPEIDEMIEEMRLSKIPADEEINEMYVEYKEGQR